MSGNPLVQPRMHVLAFAMDFCRRKHVTIQAPFQGRFYEFLDRTLGAAPSGLKSSSEWQPSSLASPFYHAVDAHAAEGSASSLGPQLGRSWRFRLTDASATKGTAQSVGSTPSKSRDRTPPRFWDEGGALP